MSCFHVGTSWTDIVQLLKHLSFSCYVIPVAEVSNHFSRLTREQALKMLFACPALGTISPGASLNWVRPKKKWRASKFSKLCFSLKAVRCFFFFYFSLDWWLDMVSFLLLSAFERLIVYVFLFAPAFFLPNCMGSFHHEHSFQRIFSRIAAVLQWRSCIYL